MDFSFKFSGMPEKAPSLWNSLGFSKTRLHFSDNCVKGKDKYAVYAKQMILKPGEATPENKGRFIYHKMENSNVVYKINKASLQKRLGITSKEIKSVTDHRFGNLIKQKLSDKGIQFAQVSSKGPQIYERSDYRAEVEQKRNESLQKVKLNASTKPRESEIVSEKKSNGPESVVIDGYEFGKLYFDPKMEIYYAQRAQSNFKFRGNVNEFIMANDEFQKQALTFFKDNGVSSPYIKLIGGTIFLNEKGELEKTEEKSKIAELEKNGKAVKYF